MDINDINTGTNPRESLLRQRAEERKKLFLQSASEDDAYEHIRSLWDLGDHFSDERALQSAERTYMQMLEAALEYSAIFNTPRIRRSVAVSHGKLGNTAALQEKHRAARERYLESMRLFELYSAEFPEACGAQSAYPAERDIALTHRKLGNVAFKLGDIDIAQKHYSLSFETIEKLDGEASTKATKNDLALSREKLGDIRYCRKKYFLAYKAYTACAEAFSECSNKISLGRIYKKIGDCLRMLGRAQKAEENYLLSLSLRHEIDAQYSTFDSRNCIAATLSSLSLCSLMLEDTAKANEYCDAAFEIYLSLAEEKPCAESRRHLALAYGMKAHNAHVGEDYGTANEYYLMEIELRKEMLSANTTADVKSKLALAYANMGDLKNAENELAAAKSYYLLSLELHSQLENDTKNIACCRDISHVCKKIGSLGRLIGDTELTALYYERALSEEEKIAKYVGTTEALHDLAKEYMIAAFTQMPEKKKAYFERAHGIWSDLAERRPFVKKFAAHRDAAAKLLSTL